jgi:CRISPR-associated protein Cas1
MESQDNAMPLTAPPPIPARMLNEFVYCPRLGYLMWVQGEFAESADTVEGKIKHRRVDKKADPLPKTPEETETIHARSVWLTSEALGLTAKIDLVEGEGKVVTPVDYKRSKRPHVAAGAYDPERVQLCAQGLLLREHGFASEAGILYFAGSRERVRIDFDQALIDLTMQATEGLRELAAGSVIPPPLDDSPKCPRCSLVGICLPDEVGFLAQAGVEPRPLVPALESGLPLYVQSPRAYVRKVGETLVIEEEKHKVAEARLGETSQVVLFGSTGISTPALQECMRREIPVTFMSYGGWFIGHSVGTGHKNVETRTLQYRASFDPETCLKLARSLVAAKIANCRTLLRRNRKTESPSTAEALAGLQGDLKKAMRGSGLDTLLGIEGAAASRYFRHFATMLVRPEEGGVAFDFNGRNRRPPRDPVNAMLSFAYAMMVREWTVTLSAVGLDPYRGFYHQPRFGRPALALDMMEPFRPLVADSAVIMAVNNGEVKPEDFILAAGSCALKEGARKRFIACLDRRLEQEVTHPIFGYRISYRRLFEVQARLLVRFLAGEIPRFPNFLTR